MDEAEFQYFSGPDSGRDLPTAAPWRRKKGRRPASQRSKSSRTSQLRSARRERQSPRPAVAPSGGPAEKDGGPPAAPSGGGDPPAAPRTATSNAGGRGTGRYGPSTSDRDAQSRAALRDEAVRYFQGRTAPFTQRELGELLTVTRFTLLQYRKKGVLKAFVRGNVVRYHVEDVYELLRSQTI